MTLLQRCEPTLPASWYYDVAHHRRELESIWYRSWLCVGRAEEWAEAGAYRVHRIGDQAIVVTRGPGGGLHAFHNTCRHRGSELCSEPVGRFKQQRIVCPYHSWTYALSGELLATPHRLPSEDFDPSRFGLYRVGLECTAGFVFVNLEARQADPTESPPDRLRELAHWPLAELTLAHRQTHALACNWKVFWENYSECYHCPRIHPELCTLVPMYGHAVVSAEDDPAPRDPALTGGSPLAPGAATWTLDGKSQLPGFAGLSEDERRAGMTFRTLLPGMFIVAHVDYVRSVRVRPLGAEQTELVVDWLVSPEARASPKFDLETLVALGRLVVTQDGRVCEINQRGLRSRAHAAGVLVAQEHGVHELHEWIRARLNDSPPPAGDGSGNQ